MIFYPRFKEVTAREKLWPLTLPQIQSETMNWILDIFVNNYLIWNCTQFAWHSNRRHLHFRQINKSNSRTERKHLRFYSLSIYRVLVQFVLNLLFIWNLFIKMPNRTKPKETDRRITTISLQFGNFSQNKVFLLEFKLYSTLLFHPPLPILLLHSDRIPLSHYSHIIPGKVLFFGKKALKDF